MPGNSGGLRRITGVMPVQISSALPPVSLLLELGLLDHSGNSTRRAIASVNLPSNTVGHQYNTAYNTLSGLTYLVVVVCSVAIVLRLRRSLAASQQSGVTANGIASRRSQARQINAVLLVQALIPLLFDYIPANVVTAAFTKLSSGSLTATVAFVCAWQTWAPVVNAAAIILVVGSYRKALFNRQMTTTQTVSVVVNARREPVTVDIHWTV